eukprot:GDKH01004393.1.p1 GENE.GDKH01004393.1~~GDKH01004393.1.p1  ORF type:complete len:193 (+),score=48.20 GDKH01004393.1:90-668(+)
MVKLTTDGIKAWYMPATVENQREPNQLNPPEAVSVEQLAALGVECWQLSGNADDKELAEICEEGGYDYNDVVTCSPDKLPCYEEKLKMFFEEHIHADPEVRYVLDGSGYFDVRDKADRWVRIEVKKGHLITLPAGIYHRFTMDEANFTQAMRLFQGVPVWVAINRGGEAEDHVARKRYEKEFGAEAEAAAAS